MMKNIKHIIKHDGIEINVGATTFDTNNTFNYITSFYEKFFVAEIHTHTTKMIECEIPYGATIILYKLQCKRDGENTYYIVNHKPHYNPNYKTIDEKYLDKIIYDESLKADNDLSAIREFTEIYETYFQ